MSSFLGFALGGSANRTQAAAESTFQPRTHNVAAGWVLPLPPRNTIQEVLDSGRRNQDDDTNAGNVSQPCREIPLDNQVPKRRKLCHFQWRVDLCRIYGDFLQAKQEGKKSLTLYGYCMQREFLPDRYGRISQIWKELHFDKLLERRVSVDADEFNSILTEKFPAESGKTKPRNRDIAVTLLP